METVSDKGVAAGVAADSFSLPGVIPTRESPCRGVGSLFVNTPATARVPNTITITAAAAPTNGQPQLLPPPTFFEEFLI